MDSMKWNTKLLILRTLWGDSQRDLAERVGVNAGTLNRWLSGRHEPRISQAMKLANAYGVTLDELFNPNTPLRETVSRTYSTQPAVSAIEKSVSEAASGEPAPPSKPSRPPHAAKAKAHGRVKASPHRKK